jgi:serine/threonine-protein kinase
MQGDDPRIGRVLDDKYRIAAFLGEGATATVYRAERLAGGDDVAIKIIKPPEHTSRAEAERRIQRFRREALAISRLSHPNTVRLFDYGVMPGGLRYMVLELLDGRTLGQVISAAGRVDPRRAARIGRKVCLALSEAHALGIIHRDIKPANIFLETDGEGPEVVKVVDFGAVSLAPQLKERTITVAGATVGSAPYMSPEQARADALTPASDLYSLGISLYEALTGRLPFDGSFVELMSQHSFAEPPPLAIAGAEPGLVAAWQAVLAKLLAKDAAQRPQSAEDVARLLLAIEGGPTSLQDRARKAADASRAPAERRVSLWVGLAAALAAAAAGLIWVMTRG